MPNLLTEFAVAVNGMTAATDGYLKSLGVPEYLLYGGASHVGVTRAELSDEGTYQPFDAGVQVLVSPVGIQGEDGWDVIVDLVAFRARDPSRWWYRTGVGRLLNPEGVRRAEHFGAILPVWSSPMSWLRSGAQGVVILDWSVHLPFWLSGVQAVACENRALAVRLQAALKIPAMSAPDVRVIRTETAHAA